MTKRDTMKNYANFGYRMAVGDKLVTARDVEAIQLIVADALNGAPDWVTSETRDHIRKAGERWAKRRQLEQDGA